MNNTMITHIKGSHADLSDIERELVEERLVVLESLQNGEEAYSCEVEVERSAHHLNGDVVRVEVVLALRGYVFRAVATRDTLANALDEVREEITRMRSEEHTSELQSQFHLVCRLLLEKYT